MTAREIWDELYPDKPWECEAVVLLALAAEVRTLRTLTDTIVTTALDEQAQRRSYEEIQRAHDIVGQYCYETKDEKTFELVASLCWILRHDHNTVFGGVLSTIERRLEDMGIPIIRLPELTDPARE